MVRSPSKSSTLLLRLLCCFVLGAGSPSIAREIFDKALCDQAWRDAYLTEQLGFRFQRLPPHQRQFLKEYLLPTVGRRSMFIGAGEHRTWRIRDNGVTLSGFGPGQDINIIWVEKGSEPYFRFESNNNRTLFIPKDYDLESSPVRVKRFLLKALRGHTLHPYVSSSRAPKERQNLSPKEAALILKDTQREGIAAFEGAMEAGDDSFLFVGPTGVGKTIVMQGALTHLLQKNHDALASRAPGEGRKGIPSLHILFANQVGLVDQLHDDILAMPTHLGYETVRWGGTNRELTQAEKLAAANAPETIDELVRRAESGEPVVLVTTIQTIINKLDKGPFEDPEENRKMNIALLKDHLASLFIDEAHNAGAELTNHFLDDVRGISRNADVPNDRPPHGSAPVVGFTATPIRRDKDLISHVFHDNAFWAYLDNAEGYLKARGKFDRSATEILTQLQTALELGESHPFDTHFINPWHFQDETGHPLFLYPMKQGERVIMNPEQYGNVFNRLRPILENNEHLFFASPTTTEADNLAAFARNLHLKTPSGKEHVIGVLHSNLSPSDQAEIKEKFRKGEITMLFTVGMLDEGINVPTLTAYIDTNHSIAPKELLQRVGRVLRMTEGKVKRSDIVTFQDVNDSDTAMVMDALYNIAKRDYEQHERKIREPRKKRRPKDPTSKGNEEDDLDEADEKEPIVLAPEIVWTASDIEAARQKFFSSNRDHVRGVDAYNKIAQYISNKGAVDEIGGTDPEGRRIHDLLTDILDKPDDPVSMGFTRKSTEVGSPLFQQAIFDFQKRRSAWRKKIETAEGTAEVLQTFLDKRRAPPSLGKNATYGETEIAAAIDRFKHDKTFIKAVLKGNAGNFPSQLGIPPSEVTVARIDDFLERRKALPVPTSVLSSERDLADKLKMTIDSASPDTILDLARAFHDHTERYPQASAVGLEGRLGKALDGVVLDGLNDKDPSQGKQRLHDLVERRLTDDVDSFHLDILAMRDRAENERDAKANAEASSKDSSSKVTSKVANVRTQQLIGLLSSPNRAALGLPPPQKEVTIKLKGGKMGSKKLISFYTNAARSLGLTVAPVVEKEVGRDVYETSIAFQKTQDSPFPSDVFAFENSVCQVAYVDKITYTNNVRVEVIGVGTPPGPKDTVSRFFPTDDPRKKIKDKRNNREVQVQRGKDDGETFSDLFLQMTHQN